MKICVIGLGYIGLPTSLMFASHNCNVTGVDVNYSVVESLNKGMVHIEEPGLGELLKQTVEEGYFCASLHPVEADAYIIAVPTPNKEEEDYACDATFVREAVQSIIPYVKKGNTIIVESTIAPRTMETEVKPIFEASGYKIGEDLYLAHCPERVLPGKILYELKYNNRIVGGITEQCAKQAAKVYEQFVCGEIILTEAKTAELSKCMENTFRDVNIALANELARVCDELDINCYDVIALANKHPRVHLLQPGPGVGGHCLAIDPYFIYAAAKQEAKLIKLARDINSSMPAYVVEKVNLLMKDIENPTIAVFGVTYKGDIDDVRESPALKVVEQLRKEGYTVKITDSHVNNEEYVSMEEAVKESDLILVLTDHSEYKTLDYEKLTIPMRRRRIFDTRSIVTLSKNTNIELIHYGNLHEYK